DDDILDRPDGAEDAVPLAQLPIDRGPAIKADIEPFMHTIHQCWAEVLPVVGTAIQLDPATAAARAQRLVFENSRVLSRGHYRAGQVVELAEAVVCQPQPAILDKEHESTGNIADREQHALVRRLVTEPNNDLEISVRDK